MSHFNSAFILNFCGQAIWQGFSRPAPAFIPSTGPLGGTPAESAAAPWGITPSFGFVEEPETNGVAERFNRTLKEQAIHGRIFTDLEEVRVAVGQFVEDYNTHWRPEKLGFRTPVEARREHVLGQVA